MDYERIETISKNLGDARINIRLRSATNLLEKLEIGVIDKKALTNSASLTTLLSGVHKAISLILESPDDLADRNKESTDLLLALLSIVRATVTDPSRSNSLHFATKIMEQLYFLKESEHIVGTVKTAVDDVSHFLHLLEWNYQMRTLTNSNVLLFYCSRPSTLYAG